MKRHLILIFLVLLTACSIKAKKIKSPYFEGFVEGAITINAGSPEMDSFLYSKYGHYATTYIKDSFVSRVYYNNARVIVGREFIRTDSLKLYQVDEASDTMLVTDLTNDYYFSNISTKEVAGKRILGKDCIGVLMINKYQPHILSDAYTGNAVYYFDSAFHLSPGLNRFIKYGSYDKVFGKYAFLTMGFDQEFDGVKISMAALRVVQNTVSPIYFEVPKNKVAVNPYLR